MAKMRSVEAHRAVSALNERLQAPLKDSQLSILRVLADHANEQFECWPSLTTIAKKTGKSKRQVIRTLQKLREQGLIAFDDNPGGQGICNHYRLQFVNSDIKGDRNGDEKGVTNSATNGITPNFNGDIWKSGTVSDFVRTVSKNITNGVIAMSPEGVEGFEWFKKEGGESLSTPLGNMFEVFDELETLNPEDLIRKIETGQPVHRNRICEVHGTFTQIGHRVGRWIAWSGHENIYSSGWTGDEGSCPGCRAKYLQSPKRPGYWPTRYQFETPALCDIHGPLILKAHVYVCEENPYVERVQVNEDSMGRCPDCESQTLREMQLQDSLGLSNEEWEICGKQVMAALASAEHNSAQTR